MYVIPGTATEMPALVVSRRETRAPNAWLSSYTTVRLTAPVVAVRVHAGAGEGAVTGENLHLVSGAAAIGRWFAIGDFVKSYDEYIASTSLPRTSSRWGFRSFFTRTSIVRFHPHTILNVGLAGPLFGHEGGAEQAEFLDGPEPSMRDVAGFWSNRYGHA